MRELLATAIHWEAVIVSAVPAAIAAVASVVAAKTGASNKRHLVEINHAVNGAPDGAPTLRENVDKINEAVNGVPDGTPSIGDNVTELVGRKDLDPDKAS